MPTSHLSRSPLLPKPFALPFGLIPTVINSRVLVTVLNRIFAPELSDGELDFLEGRVMAVKVCDAGLNYLITLNNGRLEVAEKHAAHDLSIEGSVYDFLLLATRREDADTLFFNRRIRLGGDTELGLYVKNFLDALELDGRLGPALKLMNGATSLIARMPELKLPFGKQRPVENSY